MPGLPHRPWLALSAHAADRTRQHALPAVPYGHSAGSASTERVPAGLHSLPHEYPRLKYRLQVLQIKGGEYDDGQYISQLTAASPSRRRAIRPEPLVEHEACNLSLSCAPHAGGPTICPGSGPRSE